MLLQAKPLSLMQLEDEDVQDMSLKEFLTAKRDEKVSLGCLDPALEL